MSDNTQPRTGLRIGTRGSLLATTQAGHVRDALAAAGRPGELSIVTTVGDVNMSPVERIGVGVFTQALRDALDSGEVDVAVHSCKDLPTAPDPRFHLVTPKRADPREAVISRGPALTELPDGARVGTSAPRRISQIAALRPDLDIRPLRGNIDTRMGKVTDGELDAIILAYAGLTRVGRDDVPAEVFDPEFFLPAPAQGALAVECRTGDTDTIAALDRIADGPTTLTTLAERTVLATLEAGCTAPVGAFASIRDGEIHLRAGVFALDGSRRLVTEDHATAEATAAVELGRRAAGDLLDRGAADLIADAD